MTDIVTASLSCMYEITHHASRITVTSCTLIYVESWYAHDWTFAFGMIGPGVEGLNHDWTYRTRHVQLLLGSKCDTPTMVSAQPQELPGKCEAPTSYTLYRQGKFFMSFETVKQGVRIGDGAADDHSLKLFIKSERVQLIIFK